MPKMPHGPLTIVEEHARSRVLLDESLVVGERQSATTLLVADPPTALAVTAEGATAALRVRFLRAACPACWLLDVSRLIASWMVFRARGESPASCARELSLHLSAKDASPF